MLLRHASALENCAVMLSVINVISDSPKIQKVHLNGNYVVDVLRLDAIHPIISGNKWFKLKHNLRRAILENKKSILTFGGAHSNHLAATAEACKQAKLLCIGIVRGDEHTALSDTLTKAQQAGMQIEFVNREQYKQKTETHFIQALHKKYGDFYLVPEGGSNAEGIIGCIEILKDIENYDYVLCACGSGATFAGLVASETQNTKIIGISVLKGENKLAQVVSAQLNKMFPQKNFVILGNEAVNRNYFLSHCIMNHYAFSGFAKLDLFLIDFKRRFEKQNGFILDYLYTTKLFYAVEDLLGQNKFPEGSKILVIHSGGLQGNAAFEARYKL